ncbi:uncharacterized protein LOC100821910 isoform X2 [Brachypodium distachyon]|uniref:uncharacterized protein LOC100821910 isoform X2 n=1 Tax=Brachypodium distachyon TaxID=15368 RepID=UPI00052FF54B|nr:uncharacterized protein LOC100821910 isoform X2 [Brachypodium distachyon]|eukprot:XP_010230807.1 uncharacterized protein LOC100821910 isoform X2 [Brachypodium distachyon]
MRRTKKRGGGLAGRSHKSTTPPNGKGGATDLVTSFIEKIRRTKRRGDDFTRRSHKSIRGCNGSGKTTESMALLRDLHEENWTRLSDDDFARRLHKSIRGCNGSGKITESMALGDLHGDSNRYDWTRLSDELKSSLSRSVVSLALCNGDTVLFACSSIAVDCQENHTRFLTSATLARAFISGDKRKFHDNLKIKVRHEGNEVYEGVLSEYDLYHNFAIVIINTSLDVHVGLFKHRVENRPHGMVLALARGISGTLIPTNVILASEDHDAHCQMSEVLEGGPLFTFDGNFVGMNLFLVIVKAYFVSRSSILDWLNCKSLQKKTYLPRSKSLKAARFGSRLTCDKLNGHSEVQRPIHRDDMTSGYCRDLESLGYPQPQIDMVDDPFGDAYPEGVWHEFSKSASSDIDRYVVALASFKGWKRHFACTGFFIEWNGSTTILTSASLVRSSSDENKTDEDLRIEVLLPNKRRIEGILEHYSLHYNVALVGVRNCRVVRPSSIQPYRFGRSKVASVGRCFISGALMATSGRLVSWSGTLDCRYTVRSSCKITKAGIGGPLVDMRDGKVIGMDFYDKRIGTPFLLWKDIGNILAHFAGKSKQAGEVGREDCDPSSARFWKMEGDDSDCPSRWPVPEPCWLRPDDLVEDESEDDDESGIQYGYSGGRKVLYL